MMQNGNLVQGNMPVLNFSTQASSYNYTVLTPTVTDIDDYNSTIQQLATITQGLASGGDNPCSPSDHRLDRWVCLLAAFCASRMQ